MNSVVLLSTGKLCNSFSQVETAIPAQHISHSRFLRTCFAPIRKHYQPQLATHMGEQQPPTLKDYELEG
jgi:hypothetical protein